MTAARDRERFTRRHLAAIRERMAAALEGDEEALKVLDRVYPADWGDAPMAVVWMLGNASRFAAGTDGAGCEFAQAWLNRLVDQDGNPR